MAHTRRFHVWIKTPMVEFFSSASYQTFHQKQFFTVPAEYFHTLLHDHERAYKQGIKYPITFPELRDEKCHYTC